MWLHFQGQIALSLKKLQTTTIQTLIFERLIHRAKTNIMFYQILSTLQDSHLPSEDLSITERIHLTERAIQELSSIIEKFDSSFKTWAFEESSSIEKMNDFLTDKKIAWERSLAILYMQNQQKDKAWEVRNRVVAFHTTRNQLMPEANLFFAQQFSLFNVKLRAFGNNEEHAIKDEENPFKLVCLEFNLSDSLKENIRKNLNYFNGDR